MDGTNPDPITVTLTPGAYADVTSLVNDINLQIRRNQTLYDSIRAVVGGTAPTEFIRIESLNQGSRVRGEDLNITGTALATLGLAAGNAINGGGTSPGEGTHLLPQNVFSTLIDLRDDLSGVAAEGSKLLNLFNGDYLSLGLMDGDIITVSTSTKSADFEVLSFHRMEDLIVALNEFFGTQARVRLTHDGRLEFENLETAQIANLSITAKSSDGIDREEFNALFENFPLNIPGGSKVVSEKIIDPQRYLLISDVELGRIDLEIENLLGFEAQVGARSNRLWQTRELFEDSELNIKTLKSNLEDANLAEVVTKLARMELVLESSLNVGARVLTPSLINFLQ
jgi:flagellin-like hook-associated protein FlgL